MIRIKENGQGEVKQEVVATTSSTFHGEHGRLQVGLDIEPARYSSSCSGLVHYQAGLGRLVILTT